MPSGLRVSYGISRRGVPSAASLHRWARAALVPDPRRSTVVIRVTGRRESAQLNQRFRGKSGPTNVLSFPWEDAAPNHLGDLVLCAPVIAREGRAHPGGARARWAHMVVHGVLHLLGYDHQTPRDATRMEARESRLLVSLGFPDPWLEHD